MSEREICPTCGKLQYPILHSCKGVPVTEHNHATHIEGCYRCDLSRDEIEPSTPLDLDQIEARAAAATEGPWAVYNMADGEYDSRDGKGWWWVWRAGVKHYAGVAEMDRQFNVRDKDGETVQLFGAIGTASITDNDCGATEQADAEFIAAARSDVPALVAEVRRMRAELRVKHAMSGGAVAGRAVAEGVAANERVRADLLGQSLVVLGRINAEVGAERDALRQRQDGVREYLEGCLASNCPPDARDALGLLDTEGR